MPFFDYTSTHFDDGIIIEENNEVIMTNIKKTTDAQKKADKKYKEKIKNLPEIPRTKTTQEVDTALSALSEIYGSKKSALEQAILTLYAETNGNTSK